MGREIRRVPAGWRHPTDGDGPIPMHDESYGFVAREWLANCIAWADGSHADATPETLAQYPFWWDYGGMPPNKKYYRPDWPEGTATHYQIYETVSEGTPVSPVLASLTDLEQWLTGQGTSPAAAAAFARRGWCPSGMLSAATGYVTNYDALLRGE